MANQVNMDETPDQKIERLLRTRDSQQWEISALKIGYDVEDSN